MPTIATAAGPIFSARRAGPGLPLLCLHGAGGRARHWGALVGPLAALGEVLAVDLPGHGRSPAGGPATIAGYAAAALALLDALGHQRAVVVGHSMGGAVALELARQAPGRVAGLALLGSAARLRVAPALLAGLAGDAAARAAAIDMLASLLLAPTAAQALRGAARADYVGCDPATLLADFQACDGFDLRAEVAAIRLPAIVITGAEDRLTPPRLGAELAAGLGARHLLLPNVGHMPMVEAPDATAAALRAWLTEQPA